IEEGMLGAQVSAAMFPRQHRVTGLYRVHEGAPQQKRDQPRDFQGELGLSLSGADAPAALAYPDLLAQVQDRADSTMVQPVVLRSLRQAMYQVEDLGHVGLGYDAYTHFTSPIRRYPHLLVHRAIRSVIRSELPSKQVVRVEGASLLQSK